MYYNIGVFSLWDRDEMAALVASSSNAAGLPAEARDAAPTYTGPSERTFFVVDLSRLKQEGDTLTSAMVVYRPEADLKKV